MNSYLGRKREESSSDLRYRPEICLEYVRKIPKDSSNIVEVPVSNFCTGNSYSKSILWPMLYVDSHDSWRSNYTTEGERDLLRIPLLCRQFILTSIINVHRSDSKDLELPFPHIFTVEFLIP